MAKFAGARQLSQRRRRMLAQESETSTENDGLTTEGDFEEIRRHSAQNVPISRLVSVSFWRHIVGVILINVICGLIAYAGLAESHAHTASGLLLLVSAQAAVLIGWVRGQSSFDFQARYRWWNWLASGLALLGLLQIFRLESQAFAWLTSAVESTLGPLDASRPAVRFGILAAYGLLMLWKILPDLGRSAVSQVLVAAAVILQVLSLSLQYGSTSHIPQGTLLALQLFAACELFCGLLLHLRFVIYVNHHPPESVVEVTSNWKEATQADSDTHAENVGDGKQIPQHCDQETEKDSLEKQVDVATSATDEQSSEARSPTQTTQRKRKSRRRAA